MVCYLRKGVQHIWTHVEDLLADMVLTTGLGKGAFTISGISEIASYTRGFSAGVVRLTYSYLCATRCA